MEARVSSELESVLRYARDEAMRTGHYGIGVDHLMLGILRLSDSRISAALTELGADPHELKEYLDAALLRDKPVPWGDAHLTGFTRGADGVLNVSVYESLNSGWPDICPEHLLLAICRTDTCNSRTYLENHGVNHDTLTEYLRTHEAFSHAEKEILPEADEISKAFSKELRKVMGVIPVKSQDIYS